MTVISNVQRTICRKFLIILKPNHTKLKLLKNYTVIIFLVFKYMPTLYAVCSSSDAMNERANKCSLERMERSVRKKLKTAVTSLTRKTERYTVHAISREPISARRPFAIHYSARTGKPERVDGCYPEVYPPPPHTTAPTTTPHSE